MLRALSVLAVLIPVWATASIPPGLANADISVQLTQTRLSLILVNGQRPEHVCILQNISQIKPFELETSG